MDTEEAAEPALDAVPDPATVDEAGLVLVEGGACFVAIPDVDDAGLLLAAGLVDGVVFDLPVLDEAVVDLLGLAVFAVGLAEVFLGTSVAEEEVTRVLELAALLPEDAGFPFPDATSVL